MFIESNMQYGVEIIDWEEFISRKCYKGYERIVYRRLIMKRTKEQLVNLENFIKVARSKRYKLTATKLLRKDALMIQTSILEKIRPTSARKLLQVSTRT